MKVTRLNADQITAITLVDAEAEPIQADIDGYMLQIQEAQKVVDAIRVKVKPLRALLVPLAKKKRAIVG